MTTLLRTMLGLSASLAVAACFVAEEPVVDDDVDADEQAVVSLTPCGDRFCEGDEFCCNESCSICAPLDGGTCTQQICVPDPGPGIACGVNTCGVGEVCCDEDCGLCGASDEVCPDDGCGQLQITPCGDNFCHGGEFCCNESCGICAPEGGYCNLMLCEPHPALEETCGDTACPIGTVCCNPTCGICAAPGEGCTAQRCLDIDEVPGARIVVP
jgi:hypothetical protein